MVEDLLFLVLRNVAVMPKMRKGGSRIGLATTRHYLLDGQFHE